jgi:anti-anti-sigma factor
VGPARNRGRVTSEQQFSIRREPRELATRIVVTGELDMVGAPSLEAAIAELCEAGAREIELDLRKLAFLDSRGVHALLRAREHCREHASELFVIPAQAPGPRKVLDLTGAQEMFAWRDAED